MRFVTAEQSRKRWPGVMLDDQRVLNLEQALSGGALSIETMVDVIAGGTAAMSAIRAAMAGAAAAHTVALRDVRLVAPIPVPQRNVFCVGRNYREHVAEAAKARAAEMKLPEVPHYFTKPPQSVTGPYDDILWDAVVTQQLDYEVELGVVIGRTGRNIPRERALDYVFGYTVINDVTARDLQKRHGQWFKGKGLDGYCPMGPWIVDRAALPDPQNVAVKLRVNGEVRQESNTSMMIFDLPEIISQLSQGMALLPGDVIATGTPSGVGFAMTPPRFLTDGDVVETEIEGVGMLVNRVRRIEHVVAS